jgi:hypothetical protein
MIVDRRADAQAIKRSSHRKLLFSILVAEDGDSTAELPSAEGLQ